MIEPVLRIAKQTENFSARPPGSQISLFIVHAISEVVVYKPDPEKPAEHIDALDWLTDNILGRPRVSAHWIVHPDGTIDEIASPAVKAWHVGSSRWGDEEDLNRVSVGAELIVPGAVGWGEFVEALKSGDPFTPEQYWATGWLVAENIKKRPITLDRVRGHNEVSGPDVRPDPKIDPGPHFNWRELYGWTCEALYRA